MVTEVTPNTIYSPISFIGKKTRKHVTSVTGSMRWLRGWPVFARLLDALGIGVDTLQLLLHLLQGDLP